MKIEELLNKYFEGETTCEEEQELRRFFTQGIVPKHLDMYRPLFAYLETENQAMRETMQSQSEPKSKRSIPFRRRILYTLSGIAACLIIVFTIAGLHQNLNALPENYVIIDGKCYTDATLIRQEAQEAFQEVKFNEEDVFATLFAE